MALCLAGLLLFPLVKASPFWEPVPLDSQNILVVFIGILRLGNSDGNFVLLNNLQVPAIRPENIAVHKRGKIFVFMEFLS